MRIQFVSVLLCPILAGCFQAVLLEPSELEEDNSEDIVVSTIDGRLYAFTAGDYFVISDSLEGQFLRGQGKRFREGQSEYQSFDGDIPLDQITRISHSETTPMFYISIGVGIVVIGLAILYSVAYSGGGH